MTPSRSPMATLPTASQRGSPVSDREADAGSGEDEADERADVLEQHDRQLRALGVADEAPPARRGRGRAAAS